MTFDRPAFEAAVSSRFDIQPRTKRVCIVFCYTCDWQKDLSLVEEEEWLKCPVCGDDNYISLWGR